MDAQILTQTETQILLELFPPIDDVLDTGVRGAQCSLTGRVTNRNPMVAHVFKADSARFLMLQVGDQLVENPSLIRVFDAPVLMLQDRLSEDAPPRQVYEV